MLVFLVALIHAVVTQDFETMTVDRADVMGSDSAGVEQEST